MDYKNIQNYIYIIKNAMNNDLCDEILKEYMYSNEWEEAAVGTKTINKLVRSCKNIEISDLESIEKNSKIRSNIDKNIYLIVGECISQYIKRYPRCRVSSDSGYTLLKYDKNDFYSQHVDSSKNNPRSIACSLILNDDFEGGEFAFFNREIKYKLEKGDALMFPSNFMYPHEVMPVTKGTRYSIVTWFI